MKNYTKTILITLLALFTTVAFAVEKIEITKAEDLQYNSDNHQSVAVKSTDPEKLWNNYLAKHKIKEGHNTGGSGRTFFIVADTQEVGKMPNERGFIESKDIAYRKALAGSKAALAGYLGSWIKGNVSLTEEEINEDIPKSYKKAIVKPVSTADRKRLLEDLTLDDQIKEYNPKWDGTNKTQEEKVEQIIAQEIKFTEYMSSHSREFLQGVSPIFTAEGSADGRYLVTVGIVWSFRSIKVAEAIYTPGMTAPKGKKHLLTIANRLDKMSDTEMSASMGIRLWWDEKGSPVIVSFAQTDGTGSRSIAKKKTRLKAKNQISKYVAEVTESDAEANIAETMRFDVNDNIQAFNETNFTSKINSRQSGLNLSGVDTIHYRRFIHPISNQKMVVNVMSWTPNASAYARDLRKITQDQETNFSASKGGTVFENPNNNKNSSNGVTRDDNTVSGGYTGAVSSPDDF